MDHHDPTDFETENERQAEAKAEAARELRYEIDDLKWLMGNKRGRRVVRRLLTNAGVNRLSFQTGDASATAFMEGQRNQGLRLLALIMEHASSDYVLMVQEQFNAR